ncbi:MAG: response regulator [Verrucomicrobiales bacterium]|nr:response regulator [Verrucomicrobiales bacterium]
MVFAVDDEPMLLELIALVLEPMGFQVRTFRDPAAAIEAFRRSQPPPVLVVTDYSMHSMTGLDLVRECRRLQPDQKVILVSGTVDASVYQGERDKPNRFLAKPYHAEQLAAAVRAVLAD